jgi:hypothetical protein
VGARTVSSKLFVGLATDGIALLGPGAFTISHLKARLCELTHMCAPVCRTQGGLCLERPLDKLRTG